MNGVPSPPHSDRVSARLEHVDDPSLDPVDLFRVLYRAASTSLDTSGFYLGLYDIRSQMVDIVRQIESGNELAGGAFPLGQGLTSQVIRTRQPFFTSCWSEQGLPVQVQYATSRSELPESTITVPIIGPVSDEVLGVLAIQSYARNAYDSTHLELLLELAAAAGRVIETWRRRDRALSEMTRRSTELEAILASLSEGLMITDANGAIVRLNAAARVLLVPLSDSIILGQPLDHEATDKWPVQGRPIAAALAELVGLLRRGEARQNLELDLWHDGHRTISLSASPLHSAAGEPAGGVIVIRDVTEQRALDRLKARVLQIASHDLQTPLTVVRGRAQWLELRINQGTEDPEWLREGLAAIVAQTDRVSDMLRMLLDLSLVEGGRIDLHRCRTNLVTLVREAADEAKFLSDGHTINVDAPSDVEGEWDGARLRQVLQNLIKNAIKYSPDGGPVDVRVSESKGQVEVSVRDQGIGLASEEASRAFEQFYRAAAARRIEGSGLGLYICQAIVAAHGGHVCATSPGPGKGSTFSFVLPLKPASVRPEGS
jgi:two-component system, OmpR family, phosphate regulon sensor histidine kinase PhoR